MAGQVLATTQLIDRRLKRWAARQPRVAHYDGKGRRDTVETAGIIIGSQTAVDVSYCVDSTNYVFVPPM